MPINWKAQGGFATVYCHCEPFDCADCVTLAGVDRRLRR